jgi:Icc-related predicted phosphoesterase
MHILDKKFIVKQLQIAKKKKLTPIVITHYPPVIDAVKESRLDDLYLSLYSNNLENILSDAKVWISGHTHNNYMKYKNNCLLVSNQLGKEKDNITDFSKRKIITI